jgi:Flp pilus assembly protein TadG
MMPSASVKLPLCRRLALWRNRAGGAAVEFALIAPPLFAMIFGTVILGLGFHQGVTVQWSMERSLRAAMLDADVTEEEIAALMAQDLELIGSPAVELSYAIDESGPAPLALVTATHEVPFNVPFAPEFSLTFTASNAAPIPNW